MDTTVLILSLVAAASAQWGIPGAGGGMGSIMGAGMGQAQGPFGVYGGAGLPDPSRANQQLAVDLSPQFAQFGSPYQNYGAQSVPVEPTSVLAGSRGPFDMHPFLLPSQTHAVRQFTPQPGAFGLQLPSQNPYSQMGLGTAQLSPFSPFQADDYAGSVKKEATVPPSQPIRVIPPFLKEASKEDQDKNIYSQFQRASSSEVTAKRQKVHEAVAAMSPEAQQQFQKVSALMTNPRIPEQERLEKIQDLYAKIPDSIKREFDSKFVDLLNTVKLEPAPKPTFLINATYDAIKQFMSIYRAPAISQIRKVTS
ncbi:hypothetical protein OESDEN_12910 [Oesophagostomum dentatum]|uniref:SXP/RAL-2 family protein Ani s 5-like cation-binding domain-containing protein n=1 Tax=Oesophagostomum dentatum TaxID=61180 RepID=A0A0B1SPQ9_OESDE|nr:hypothetical protein OESDEN_12910 [Oesophagostomum dentatum]